MFRILKDVIDLQKVVDRLQNYGPLAYKVVGHVTQVLLGRSGDEIVVDEWPEFQVVLARPTAKSLPYTKNCYSVFAFDNQTDKLSAFLSQDGLLDWKRELVFAGFDWTLSKTLQEVVTAKGCELNKKDFGSDSYAYIMELKDDISMSSIPPFPPGYSLGVLEQIDAQTVSNEWEYSSEGCKEYVEHLVANHCNVCVRYEPPVEQIPTTPLNADSMEDDITPISDDMVRQPQASCCAKAETGTSEGTGTSGTSNLVAWYLEQPYGALGMLHVMEAHRGRGLAHALTLHLAAKIQAERRPVFIYVMNDNNVSLKLQQKCGFQIVDGAKVVWGRCSPRQKKAKCGETSTCSSTKCCV